METEYQDQDDVVSDSKSCVSGPANSSDLFHGGLAMLDEDEDKAYSVIKHRFMSSLSERFASRISMVAIHKRNWFGRLTAQAKVQLFQIHRRLLEKQPPEDVNLNLAWFGTSGAGVERIIFHGFGLSKLKYTNGLYGRGVYLSPNDSSYESVQSADVDEDGLRYVLLCRVLLGRMEG